MKRHSALSLHGLALLCAVVLGLVVMPARVTRAAGPLVVDTTSDGYIGGVCTLREAIDTVNAGSDQSNDCGDPSASSPANTITFSLPSFSTITLAHNSGQNLVITHSVTIDGPFDEGLEISGSGTNRVFLIAVGNINAPVLINNVGISNGNVGSKPGGAMLIQSQSDVTFNRVVIKLSTSLENGGGVYVEAGSALTLFDSSIGGGQTSDGNHADKGGGIYNAGTLDLNNSAVFYNVAPTGGGIYNVGTMTAGSDTQIWYNLADGHGGGIFNAVGGEVTLNGIEMGSNTADNDANDDGDGGNIYNQATLTLNRNTELLQGAAHRGGGIFQAIGTLSVDNTLFDFQRQSSGDGGGIYLDGATSVSITNSLFDENETYNGTSGAGIYAAGSVSALIANTTFTGNFAHDAGTGSSIYWGSTGTLTLNNVTIYNNTDDSGGSLYATGGSLNISNTILDNCDGNPAAYDTTPSYNLIRTGTTCVAFFSEANHNIFVDSFDTVLDPIPDDHGGVWRNFALIPGSPAIDAGNPATPLGTAPACETTDTRGVDRPQGDGCDIGAFELEVESTGSHHNKSSGEEQPPDNLGGNCAALGGDSFTYNGSADVDCRLINADGVFKTDPGEVGNIDLINRGILQAIDLFRFDNNGNSLVAFDAPVTVCLRGTGQFVFINAANTPRTIEAPAAYTQGGYTCASIPNAGMALLIPGEAAPAGGTTATQTATTGETPLSNCTVTTLFRVNLHDGPSINSVVIATIPFNASYTATARSGDWIKLIWSNTQGWVRADLLTQDGTCAG